MWSMYVLQCTLLSLSRLIPNSIGNQGQLVTFSLKKRTERMLYHYNILVMLSPNLIFNTHFQLVQSMQWGMFMFCAALKKKLKVSWKNHVFLPLYCLNNPLLQQETERFFEYNRFLMEPLSQKWLFYGIVYLLFSNHQDDMIFKFSFNKLLKTCFWTAFCLIPYRYI